MCGIAGIFYKERKECDIGQALIQMLYGCQHRGRDSTGFALYEESAPDQLVLRFLVGEGDETQAAITHIKDILGEYHATIVEDETIGNNYRVKVIFTGDIPADVRDAAIRKMVDVYFPANTVLVTGYGFDMLYAGPREAVLHAVFRQNCGCTHLIVGRDHAGVGDYYGPFDAQTIFDDISEGVLEIEIFRGDFTLWSKKLNRIVMMRDHPDHKQEDYLSLSGTKVRDMLSAGEALPEEIMRPEVAEILMKYYQEEAAKV